MVDPLLKQMLNLLVVITVLVVQDQVPKLTPSHSVITMEDLEEVQDQEPLLVLSHLVEITVVSVVVVVHHLLKPILSHITQILEFPDYLE